jgi:hypothetical protein
VREQAGATDDNPISDSSYFCASRNRIRTSGSILIYERSVTRPLELQSARNRIRFRKPLVNY